MSPFQGFCAPEGHGKDVGKVSIQCFMSVAKHKAYKRDTAQTIKKKETNKSAVPF